MGIPRSKGSGAILVGVVAGALLFSAPAYTQTGEQLFRTDCAGCHNDVDHPFELVYNAAGNAALIATVNDLGMGAKGTPADYPAIAAYLDSIKPIISLAPVAHNGPATAINLHDIKVSGAEEHHFLQVVTDIVTVSPPTKGAVTYRYAIGPSTPSVVTYTPFLGQSGVDTWTYQGVGELGNTTVRTASVNIAAGPGQPITPPDINQHGLTGSWYEPATGGQGVEVEVFPDATSSTAFVSWFTYDTVIGGAERQRWYTALGQMPPGASGVALNIYQNVGGNFNAPPTTTAAAIGTAVLSFDSCNTGQLTYRFIDGALRDGVVPLSRLTQNVTCSPTAPPPTNADFAYSGNWFTPSTSGQGFTIEVNPNSSAVFAAWYTYVPSGAAAGPEGQRWYTALGDFRPGERSIPVTISETAGGVFDTPTPPGQKTRTVGSGTLTFQSCSAATFAYNFTDGTSSGSSGSIALSRVGPTPPGCKS
jgi:hypothetical protein